MTIDLIIVQGTWHIEPNAEVKERIRVIEDPQDLNEALTAVRFEETQRRVANRIQNDIETNILKMLTNSLS